VVANLLEQSGLEEALISMECFEIPDNARAIRAARNSLQIGRGDLNAPDSVSVLFD
jgi:hypothetical protein